MTDLPEPPPRHGRTSDRRAGRAPILGWVLLVVGVGGAVALSMAPAPYVVERPGPVYDTLGQVTLETEDGGTEQAPLIDIPDATTYPTEGTLDLLTVSLTGTPERPLSWLEVGLAWFDRSRAVVPTESVYPAGITDEESDAESAQEMQTSQQEAIAAALRNLGEEVPGVVTVASVQAGSPADGVLEPGDEVRTADGVALEDVSQLREIVASHGTDSAVALGLVRDGEALEVSVVPVLSEPDDEGAQVPIVGVVTGASYDFPIDVRIRLERVGGPSAGMMFALGIIDKLTPGAMTGGEQVAGTGTITADGTVGPIGGIRQKLFGAAGAGAELFLAPVDNCDEVVGHVPDGLDVVAVATLDDAITAVETAADGGDLSALPTCTG